MSGWHANLSPENAARAVAAAARIVEHFHICAVCKQRFDGPIAWDCPLGSPTLLNLCTTCSPLPRTT